MIGPASKPELNSACFATAYRHDNASHLPPIYKESIPMEFVQISSFAVENICLLLNESLRPGPDKSHPVILKILALFIAEPLAHIFSLSLATG